jgi:hypothetical protein
VRNFASSTPRAPAARGRPRRKPCHFSAPRLPPQPAACSALHQLLHQQRVDSLGRRRPLLRLVGCLAQRQHRQQAEGSSAQHPRPRQAEGSSERHPRPQQGGGCSAPRQRQRPVACSAPLRRQRRVVCSVPRRRQRPVVCSVPRRRQRPVGCSVRRRRRPPVACLERRRPRRRPPRGRSCNSAARSTRCNIPLACYAPSARHSNITPYLSEHAPPLIAPPRLDLRPGAAAGKGRAAAARADRQQVGELCRRNAQAQRHTPLRAAPP